MATLSPPTNQGVRFDLLRRVARITRRWAPPGTERFLRRMYDPLVRQHDHFDVVVAFDDGLYIQVDSASLIEWHIFFYGHYEPEITSVIKRIVRPNFMVVDVGANIGCHSLVLSRHVERVLAFEPHPRVFQRLCGNLALNRVTNVDAVAMALSETDGSAVLQAVESAAVNQGASSFYFGNVYQQTGVVPTTVTTAMLDRVLEERGWSRFDFLKVDTEGHEMAVLRGAERSIRRFRPYVLFEYESRTWGNAGYEFAEARSLFHGAKYALYVVRNDHLVSLTGEAPAWANVLAVPI